MRILPLIVALLLMALPCAAEEPVAPPVEIPLDQIWALDMPGTRGIQAAAKNAAEGTEIHSLIEDIRQSLSKWPPKGERVRAGFAVTGDPMQMLKKMRAVLVNGEKPRTTFSSDEEVSIVFFSTLSSRYVHLQAAIRHGTKIDLSCRFVPHFTRNMTTHFAIVPLGKLQPAEYQVCANYSPLPPTTLQTGFKDWPADSSLRTISAPFGFTVLVEE